ncbi:alpha/beta hydrolase (plasmid) [Cetobacterium somerae]|uniref:alpha/beta hydrolase n=1 Tax=Cetobacterium somerae TaxID=188913 RepID=UPI003D768B9B
MKKVFNIVKKVLLGLVGLIIFIQFTRAYIYNKTAPNLQRWHETSKYEEPDYKDFKTIDDYMVAEKEFLKKAYSEVQTSPTTNELDRYSKNGEEVNGINETFQLIPEDIKGGVLLLHGLTDSPYVMKDIGKVFYEKGYYVLGLRYKYHGTYPGELLKISEKDFEDAAKFGAKMVKEKLKNVKNPEFYMVGFSTGAAATLQYITSSVKEDKELPIPKEIFWLSPAMGVSPAAKFGFLDTWVGTIPYFKKFKWLDIDPEYDLAKYNSFPKNPGIQVYYLIKKAKLNFSKLTKKEKQELPPIHTYLSLVDATVLDKDLYDIFFKMENLDNKLVVFDINRKFEDFFKPDLIKLNLKNEMVDLKFKFNVAFLSNINSKKDDKIISINYDGKNFFEEQKPNLKWDEWNFSLSHVALPISPENELYGKSSMLGSLNLKGENNSLYLSPNLIYRLRYNEFFEYIKSDIESSIN